METKDQEQNLGTNESEVVTENTEVKETKESKGPKVIAKDNQEVQDKTQSKEVKSEVVVPKTFKTIDGRELPEDEFYKEYDQLAREFTRRSQKLSELEKVSEERGTKAEQESRRVVDNEILKDVDPAIKEAIIQIMKPELENTLRQLDQKREQEEADKAYEKELTGLESKYKDFNRSEIHKKMQEPGNRIFDPETVYLKLHEAERLDTLVKEALKKQHGGVETESTGGGAKKPEGKAPTTFNEASESAVRRLRNISL